MNSFFIRFRYLGIDNKPTEKEFEKAGLPRKYLDSAFSNFKESHPEKYQGIHERWLDPIQETFDSGLSLLITGDSSVKKTELAAALLKECKGRGASVHFARADLILDRMSRYEVAEEGDGIRYEDIYNHINLLVIDDMGCQYGKTYELWRMNMLIRNRVENCNPTIMTTRMGDDEFSRMYDPSLWGFIARHSIMVKM